MARSTKENVAVWKLLLLLSEGKGFSEAAFELSMDIAVCSRLIKRLEEELGMALVDHYCRPAKLTKEAASIIPAVRSYLQGWQRLQNACCASRNMPLSLKFSIPVNVPRRDPYAIVKNYRRIDPTLELEIVSDADHEDVLNGRVDIAYLPYRPSADSLMLWPIAEIGNVMLASPDYLAANGTPKNPADLIRHDIIVRSGRHYPVTKNLTNGSECVALVSRRIAFAGDVASGREAVLSGEGIAIDLSFHTLKSEIESGRLVAVLPGWHRPKWQSTVATSKANLGNARLLNFCRWFAVHEAKASQRRDHEIDLFVQKLCIPD